MASIDLTYKGLTGAYGSITGFDDTTTIDDLIIAIAADEGLDTNYYTISKLGDPSNTISITYGDSTTAIADLGFVEGDAVLCTPNQVGTKEDRQIQKLKIAAATRVADSNARATYDITLLPTKYDGNNIVNNPNASGLIIGRPWIETVSAFTFYEAFGTTSAISTTQYVDGVKIYAESSTYDVPDFEPALVIVNDIEVVNTELRGHTLVVLDTYGDVVSGPTQYDTYIDPANVTALANALNTVSSGNIVVLVVYDASAVDAGVRSAINTGYGSTNSDTWTAQRKSHIFIGIKS
jgi:Interleukin-like EMT inducer